MDLKPIKAESFKNNLSYAFAKRHGVLVKEINENSAHIIHLAEPPLIILQELRRQLQCPLHLTEVSLENFNDALRKYYDATTTSTASLVANVEEEMDLSLLLEDMPRIEDLLESQDDAPIIRLLNALLSQAIKKQASDIHVESFEDQVTVRFRVDGILQEIASLPRVLSPLLISRVKVMAKLDIAEKRLPQDGRITLRIGGHAIDVRVSTLPASHGERLVLRLLDKKNARLDLAVLGMVPQQLQTIQRLINEPHGILLVTGPTGSGKTTSLYAMLANLNQTTRNILTVEDPIEYDLPGVGQTQVNTKVTMTFATGLRAILRQDPDVVMVGEIRDYETAEIAVQASLTGHLVLSTLHTNTAIGAITRLRDMGVEPFLLASSLSGIIAQRLIRLLCAHCKQASSNDPSRFIAKGCNHCHHTGYTSRSGIYEVITIDETLRQMIHSNANEQNMAAYAHQHTARLIEDGMEKVKKGLTTEEEVLRVIKQ